MSKNKALSKDTKLQVKSKKRVKDFAEVFTNEREIKAMCDLIPQNIWSRISSTFLEPACGDGNFLEEILIRKLDVVVKNSKGKNKIYLKDSVMYQVAFLTCFTSIYGIELLTDNANECRKRLLNIAIKYMKKEKLSIETTENLTLNIEFILSKNIVNGNALDMKEVNGKPIIFSSWTFIGTNVKREDCYFKKMMEQKNNTKTLVKEKGKKVYSKKVLQENFDNHPAPPSWKLINYKNLYKQKGNEENLEYINVEETEKIKEGLND